MNAYGNNQYLFLNLEHKQTSVKKKNKTVFYRQNICSAVKTSHPSKYWPEKYDWYLKWKLE